MKIALIAPTYLPARRANTIQVMKMAQAFTAIGHSVEVFVPYPGGRQVARLQPQQDVPPISTLPNWAELSQLYGLVQQFQVTWLPTQPRFRSYDYAAQAVSLAKRSLFDLIYTRLPQAAALAALSAYPTIYEIHDIPQGKWAPLLFKLFLRGKGAKRLVVITHALAKDLKSHFSIPTRPDFMHIAPDGVDLTRYAALPEPAAARKQIPVSLPQQGFVAGYTGHLYPGRGIQLLLSLANQLAEVTFLLVGGEPADIHRLQARITQFGIQNIELVGFVPNAQLPIYQAACDVLLMPYQKQVAASSGGDISRYLSPMKLFEYLAAGKPILASSLPVLQEILNPQNAILLPPDEPEAWAAALKQIQKNPEQFTQIAEKAHKDAAKYSWESRAQLLLSFS